MFKEKNIFIQDDVENKQLKEENEKLKKRRKLQIKKRIKWQIKKKKKSN